MSELRRALIEALQERGVRGLADEIKSIVPPAVLPDLARFLAGGGPRPGDPAAPVTTR